MESPTVAEPIVRPFQPGQRVHWLHSYPGRRQNNSYQRRLPIHVRVLQVHKRTAHIEILREDRQIRRRWVKLTSLW